MYSPDDIAAARQHLRRKLVFPPEVEERFREIQRLRYRYARGAYFGVVALAFALAPLYNETLFRPAREAERLLLVIELVWALPALAASMLASLLHAPARLAQQVQTYGVLSLWGSVLSLNLLGLLGLLSYPSGIMAASLVSVGLFCGFRIHRVAIGVTAFLAAFVAMNLALETDRVAAQHRLYESAFFWIIAVGGAMIHDQFSRHLWLQHRESRSLARIDPLTGIPNRATFQRWFDRIVSNAVREQRPVAVALIDLDHFKSVNDRFGHAVGDTVLRAAAQSLGQGTAQRPLDIHARYGGEEFAVAWYDMAESAFVPTLDALQRRLRGIHHRCERSGREHLITASIGAIHAFPRSPADTEALLLEADRLLYQAKREGRDRTVTSVRPPPAPPAAAGGSVSLMSRAAQVRHDRPARSRRR